VLEFFGASENLAFVVAIAIMMLIGVVEAFGLGAGALGHDLDLDVDGHWLSWLGIGRVPLTIMLVIFLGLFGLTGIIEQQIVQAMTGGLLPSIVAIPGAIALAVPATGLSARALAKILPQDETTAIDVGQLVGLHAHIVVGRAERGSPARARVSDFHGQSHYVLVEPDEPSTSFAQGDEVLLVRKEQNVFRAIVSDRPPFTNWIDQ
jgi:hypothetical protein